MIFIFNLAFWDGRGDTLWMVWLIESRIGLQGFQALLWRGPPLIKSMVHRKESTRPLGSEMANRGTLYCLAGHGETHEARQAVITNRRFKLKWWKRRTASKAEKSSRRCTNVMIHVTYAKVHVDLKQ